MSAASERETYRHRHIDIDILDKRKEKKRKERRFYVPDRYQILFEKLEAILKREESSLSEWIRDQAEPYVRLHEPGNPQQRLDIILIDKKSYKAPKFCGYRRCNREAVGFGVFLETGEKYPLCKMHFHLAKTDRKMWRVEH